jgi:hypothetical protein
LNIGGFRLSLSEPLVQAIHTIHQRLSHLSAPWLIGGSCGLILQNLAIQSTPRDLDIYVDRVFIEKFHHALSEFATDPPVISTTERYESILAHYQIAGITLEIVGGFHIHVTGATYQTRVAELLYSFSSIIDLAGTKIHVMPLAHELLFNLFRQRPDRYELIADAIRAQIDMHISCLNTLLASNRIDHRWILQIANLLHIKESELSPSGGAAL